MGVKALVIKKKITFFWDITKFNDKFPTAIKLEGGGVMALMALPLEKISFFAASLMSIKNLYPLPRSRFVPLK